MRKRVGPIVRALAVMCLLACATGRATAQDEGDLVAKQRVFSSVGPGLRTVKRGADGRLYILASPSPGLLVFDAQGKQVLSIRAAAASTTAEVKAAQTIAFGEDCDVDAAGRIYVADRGENLLSIFMPDGE